MIGRANSQASILGIVCSADLSRGGRLTARILETGAPLAPRFGRTALAIGHEALLGTGPNVEVAEEAVTTSTVVLLDTLGPQRPLIVDASTRSGSTASAGFDFLLPLATFVVGAIRSPDTLTPICPFAVQTGPAVDIAVTAGFDFVGTRFALFHGSQLAEGFAPALWVTPVARFGADLGHIESTRALFEPHVIWGASVGSAVIVVG